MLQHGSSMLWTWSPVFWVLHKSWLIRSPCLRKLAVCLCKVSLVSWLHCKNLGLVALWFLRLCPDFPRPAPQYVPHDLHTLGLVHKELRRDHHQCGSENSLPIISVDSIRISRLLNRDLLHVMHIGLHHRESCRAGDSIVRLQQRHDSMLNQHDFCFYLTRCAYIEVHALSIITAFTPAQGHTPQEARQF